ncbi:hypothetical protein LOZ51_004938 [Ophidiomyces ophidiicola]|nr:hypothetical protein LOZ54_005621 [Ophidiomyces ophidiicola]KAI1989698.1 hypothetical protein LOZ51_004938 [Ophidiomyces ophidiicola]
MLRRGTIRACRLLSLSICTVLLFALLATKLRLPSLIEIHNESALKPSPAKPSRQAIQPERWPASDYSRALVVAKLKAEDTSWVDRIARNDPSIATAVYVVDDPMADPFIIKNKGNEMMPYLTYIIDNYENLRNVTLFMHAHNATWHNDAVLDGSSEMMVNRLNPGHVVHEGYVNLRCSHHPGCPDHIHPNAKNEDEATLVNIPQAAIFKQAWRELFHGEPVPDVVSQPCCSQFAVSSERIRSIPLPKYVFWRDWVLRTSFSDGLTGRVWEYLWQYVFTGKPVLCPDEFTCVCKVYGVCFPSKKLYQSFAVMREEIHNLTSEIYELKTGSKSASLQERIFQKEERVSRLERDSEEIRAHALGG